MPLSTGTRVGCYEVQSPLGAGGMGEVYKARDTKLNRDVAIKVLLPTVANDPERLARFSREAQVLASLNHPHIAQIYGLEDAGDVTAIVMEMVEGPTVADRLAHGSIPMDEALSIARQIADALEAAHEHGIVHRDLKPANIKIRPDGTVKVLDFGLAKPLDAAGPSSLAGATAISNSPTISSPAMTQAGIILGTAAYMSPEQATGKPVDKRTDLWAFGVVFFEMLTGRQLFTGETVPHVLAEVLRSEPDWGALPPETPPPIRRLLRRCLAKDRRRRFDSAGDARLEIDDAVAAPQAEALNTRPRRIAGVALAAMAAGTVIGALATIALTRPASQKLALPVRFVVTPPPAQPLRLSPFERSLAISPDGRHLVYTSPSSGTGGPIIVHSLDRLEPQPLPGVTNARQPSFSPDGQSLVFFDGSELKRIAATGGPAITICAVAGGPRGASWGTDNAIVFATTDPRTGLLRVPAGGGEPTALTTPDAASEDGDHIFPSVLPNGRGVLFTLATPGQPEKSKIAVLDSTTGRVNTVVGTGSQAEYVDSGHLVYATAGTLRAVRFDLATLEVLSDPVPVLDGLTVVPTGAAYYVVSQSGTLLYVPGSAYRHSNRSLVWVDRSGKEQALAAPPRNYGTPRLSPDGTRAAVEIRDEENDIWIWDFAKETLRKLTYGAAFDVFPVWTLDGRRIIYASNRDGASSVYAQLADGTGTAQRLTAGGRPQIPTSLTRDGSGFTAHEDGPASFDIVLFTIGPSASMSSPPRSLVNTSATEHNAEISPDGRYLAYQSNQSGRFEVYVRPFPEVDKGHWQVSTGGGTRPAWARNGRELFYVSGDGASMLAVQVDTSQATFSWGNPVKLFDHRYTTYTAERAYDISLDGRRFLVVKDNQPETSASMTVVLNWFQELNAKLPPG